MQYGPSSAVIVFGLVPVDGDVLGVVVLPFHQLPLCFFSLFCLSVVLLFDFANFGQLSV